MKKGKQAMTCESRQVRLYEESYPAYNLELKERVETKGGDEYLYGQEGGCLIIKVVHQCSGNELQTT